MHWKVIYYRNALKSVLLEDCIEKGFTRGLHWKGFLLKDCIGKGFIREINWKGL